MVCKTKKKHKTNQLFEILGTNNVIRFKHIWDTIWPTAEITGTYSLCGMPLIDSVNLNVLHFPLRSQKRIS